VLGGAWTFLAAIATPLFLVVADETLGENRAPLSTSGTAAFRWLPRLYILLQLAATGWAAALVIRPATSVVEAAGLALSAGVTTGVFGFVAAHEMIHSRDQSERSLGLALLGSVFYMHFRIAHVHGHHLRAATRDDPASARFGEGLYTFLMRSAAGQFREAWRFEEQRRRRLGRPAFGIGNRMVVYGALEAGFLAAIALVSLRALAFAIAVAFVAVVLLESFNYIAHYGLSRGMRPDGRRERLGPMHSWNSSRRMNNAGLFNMGRHSDHHRRMARSYEQLQPVTGNAELPCGYAAALLTATVPPLWRRMMDDRAKAVMAAPIA